LSVRVSKITMVICVAAVAGAAAAASIRAQGSKSKDLPPVGTNLIVRNVKSVVEVKSLSLFSDEKGRVIIQSKAEGEEAEASEQSVAASESEDKESTAAAKVSAVIKLKGKAKMT
jgi:hypothetical protein